MNDHDIESLLAGLEPRAPSPALVRRVAEDLELDGQWLRPARRAVPRRWAAPFFWSAAGAAAALAVMTMIQPPFATPKTELAASQSATSLLPVSTIREIVRTEDEGIQFNESSKTHEQHLRLHSLERQAWIDARDGARITVELPREESFVLPVSYQ